MPLNLTVNDGDLTPYLKYNAKAGRFYVRPDGSQQDEEVINPRLAFDMERIKTGWIYYQEGAGPEKVWDPSQTQMAPRPPGSRKFKRGFEVMVFGADRIPRVGQIGLREFSSTASNVISAILSMYDEYERGMAANPGCVPFFACTGVTPVQGAYGTNYEPSFELRAWVQRGKVPAFDEAAKGGNAIGGDAPALGPEPPPITAPSDSFDDEIPF